MTWKASENQFVWTTIPINYCVMEMTKDQHDRSAACGNCGSFQFQRSDWL